VIASPFRELELTSRWCSALRLPQVAPIFATRGPTALKIWEDDMAWNTPKIVEVAVGMEINMYACAARK
jgi:coenzyme PQQ precursor peptide PqqA